MSKKPPKKFRNFLANLSLVVSSFPMWKQTKEEYDDGALDLKEV